LVHYAKTQGFVEDKKRSTKRSVALKKDQHDKIIVTQKNGIWMYFSVYDDQDKGTIIDFIKNRYHVSLVQIGKELSHYLGTVAHHSSQSAYQTTSESPFNPQRIQRLFNSYSIATDHPYLSGRGIASTLLQSNRFYAKVYQDRYGNAVFPHFKGTAPCGLELKGKDMSIMVRGSEKTLWRSNLKKADRQLIIAEAPIDAMSYQALFSLQNAFYVASSGGISTSQLQIITQILTDYPRLQEVIIITDHDTAGNRLANKITDQVKGSSFGGKLKHHQPEQKGWDWNEVLVNQ